MFLFCLSLRQCGSFSLFFFFKSRWRQSQETPSKAAQLTLQHCVPSRNTLTRTLQWFWPFARPLLLLRWGRKLQRFTWICTSMTWPFSVLQQGHQLFPFSWLNSSHSPRDTRLWVSFQQPTAGSPFLLARAAETLRQNKIRCSHVGRWKGLFQDDFIWGQMVALGYALKDWSCEVLISTRAEGSTQHLAKTRSRN